MVMVIDCIGKDKQLSVVGFQLSVFSCRFSVCSKSQSRISPPRPQSIFSQRPGLRVLGTVRIQTPSSRGSWRIVWAQRNSVFDAPLSAFPTEFAHSLLSTHHSVVSKSHVPMVTKSQFRFPTSAFQFLCPPITESLRLKVSRSHGPQVSFHHSGHCVFSRKGPDV